MDNKVTGKQLMEALIVITPWIADILQVDMGFAVTDESLLFKKMVRQ